MVLSEHADPETIVDTLARLNIRKKSHIHSLAYASRFATQDIPKYTLPETSSEAVVAYQMIHDMLEFDGSPAKNLASFLSTWMEPEAEKLMVENLAKNLADQDEYPATMRIQDRCVSILSHMWKIPSGQKAVGTATVGSSEAVQLGGLAMKWRWRDARKAAGKDVSKPNIIYASNAQVALEKFARYFDVEARVVPVSEKSRFCLDVEKAIKLVDENTIGIYVIMGSTYTGHYENVEAMSKALDDLQKRTGLDIPIHVDAASGGFVAPFASPNLKWAFDLPRVVSINTSGHKYGLCYAGIGWIIWRSSEYLPQGLVFQLHYLGGSEATYTLNFSRPASSMIAQYYNLIRLGRKGYTDIITNCLTNARLLSCALEKTEIFEVVSDIHRPRGQFYNSHGTAKCSPPSDYTKNSSFNDGLPVVAFTFSRKFKEDHPDVEQQFVVNLLRARGWIVPSYPLPPDCENIEILRVVVRESMTEELVELLVTDILWAVNGILEEGQHFLSKHTQPSSHNRAEAFTSDKKPDGKHVYSRVC
ncbi:glutamate decarboxylase [Spizellomyces punctatus DAOM BR117]|uniref:Glutamate decarboxylase n=1 Tax=Spizellomyces punctatus (strain DAOM BR117) TaxID=645134 RepID=A0A0L0HE08_SPIPD|nr:glutamate decarboxylase [Spizellomyces punctatus DAOM BR117]KNC99342.1 glutamate decarboxylase [Spizellomyces punctatus DAOM BR117]|eukprot:XP_016607382.1 glutamate decarboxylase [Spizellomyces punctatus DAOM BR117]